MVSGIKFRDFLTPDNVVLLIIGCCTSRGQVTNAARHLLTVPWLLITHYVPYDFHGHCSHIQFRVGALSVAISNDNPKSAYH